MLLCGYRKDKAYKTINNMRKNECLVIKNNKKASTDLKHKLVNHSNYIEYSDELKKQFINTLPL